MLTLAQALHHVCTQTGWVANKREFADLCGIEPGNMYNYLASPENGNRIRATQETIVRWCQQIAQKTSANGHGGLRVSLHAEIDSLRLCATGVRKNGRSFKPFFVDAASDGAPLHPLPSTLEGGGDGEVLANADAT